MLVPPLVHLEQVDRATLNRLLERWGHRMGPLTRPHFAIESHHALFEHGEPVAVTGTGETVRATVGRTDLRRDEVVELVRVCAARPHLCRAMLRLWREFALPAIASAHRRRFAVSYQDESLHSGNLYRFDGWIDLGKAGRGGTDSRTGRPGRKLRIWGWPVAPADTSELRGRAA